MNEFNNHRYVLHRSWLGSGGLVNFIMLNPSTATDVYDDATIRRCVGFAKRWHYSGLVVTNLFAFRATCPTELIEVARKNADLAIGGSLNDEVIRTESARANSIVAAWGNHGGLLERDRHVCQLLIDRVIGSVRMTKEGNPAHPVREPYTDEIAEFLPARRIGHVMSAPKFRRSK